MCVDVFISCRDGYKCSYIVAELVDQTAWIVEFKLKGDFNQVATNVLIYLV